MVDFPWPQFNAPHFSRFIRERNASRDRRPVRALIDFLSSSDKFLVERVLGGAAISAYISRTLDFERLEDSEIEKSATAQKPRRQVTDLSRYISIGSNKASAFLLGSRRATVPLLFSIASMHRRSSPMRLFLPRRVLPLDRSTVLSHSPR